MEKCDTCLIKSGCDMKELFEHFAKEGLPYTCWSYMERKDSTPYNGGGLS